MKPTTEHTRFNFAKDRLESKPSITAGEAVAFLESIRDQITDVKSIVNPGMPQSIAWKILHGAAKAIEPSHPIHPLVFKNIKREFGHLHESQER